MAQTVLEKFHPKPSQAAFSTVLNVDNCQPDVDSEIISGAVVGPTSMKVRIKFDNSRSNRSRDI